jgi:hypothetical protein
MRQYKRKVSHRRHVFNLTHKIPQTQLLGMSIIDCQLFLTYRATAMLCTLYRGKGKVTKVKHS